MKTSRFLLNLAAALALCLVPAVASAQPLRDAPCSFEPTDGGLVRVHPEIFWNVTNDADLNVKDSVKIADDLRKPTLSPDGKRVLLTQRAFDGKPGKLLQWTEEQPELEVIMEDEQVSDFVTWTENDRFFMREKTQPFAKNAMKRNFNVENSKALFKSRRIVNEERVIVYDEEDVIIMKHNGVLQAISDVTIDRYYSPILSPKQDYIVFSGLTTGINVFSVDLNQVVFQARGTDPVFSADGRYIVYGSTTDDGNTLLTGDIMILDLQNRTVRKLANPNHEIRVRGSVSNDLTDIAYETFGGESFKAKIVK